MTRDVTDRTEFAICFPPLDVSILLTCNDASVSRHLRARFADPLGVPAALNMDVAAPGSYEMIGTVHIDARDCDPKWEVRFSGTVSTALYSTDLAALIGDVYTVVFAALQTGLLPRAAVAAHAAFIEIGGKGVLLVGASGAGKSSTALAAINAGMTVHSAELSVVSDGQIVLGESNLAISAGATEKFGLGVPASARQFGSGWLVPLPQLPSPRTIDILVVPRVATGEGYRESLTHRSAQVSAFESVTSQVSLFRMVGGRTLCVNVPWDADFARRSIEQAFRLCAVPTWVLGGHPDYVVRELAGLVTVL